MTTLVNSHLHIDHVGGNQLFKGTGVRNVMHEQELAQARNHEPFEFFGYSDKSWDYEGANIETVSGDTSSRRASGCTRRRATRSATTRCLRRGRGRRCCSRSTSRTRRRRSRRGSSPASTTTRSPACARSRASRQLAAEHGAEIFFSHDMDAWQGYKHAPDFYEL